jgi:hypothetical protein
MSHMTQGLGVGRITITRLTVFLRDERIVRRTPLADVASISARYLGVGPKLAGGLWDFASVPPEGSKRHHTLNQRLEHVCHDHIDPESGRTLLAQRAMPRCPNTAYRSVRHLPLETWDVREDMRRSTHALENMEGWSLISAVTVDETSRFPRLPNILIALRQRKCRQHITHKPPGAESRF